MVKSLKEDSQKYTTTCSCDEDPIQCLQHMFVDLVQKGRVAQGQCPVRRPVFLRTHGILKGTLTLVEKVPAAYRVGLWAQSKKSHPVYVRYSSDLADGRPDWKSTIGIGIKIFGIPGKKVVSDDGADTADLLLQNVPNFFVDTARDMCGFTKASLEGWSDEWIQEHAPKTAELLDQMAKPIRSVFGTQLWSVIPFRLGDDFCKYVVKPGTSTFAEEPDIDDPNFLGNDLAARMAKGPATIDIFIQKRPDAKKYGQAYLDEHYPLDRATVVWDEKEAVPVKIATIQFPQQDIRELEQETYGDWLAFNVGRVPAENEPVGSVAEARMKVYQASANYRRKENDQPVTEPKKAGSPKIKNPKCPFPHHPAPVEPTALTQDQIDRITDVRIHPGIGVARVGNSATDYYIGPETMNPPKTAWGGTRDPGGAIKRQAARFRVYGYDKYGNVVAEIQQADGSSVEWSVQVANRKGWWYEFNAAMDIPATVDLTVPLRNPDVSGSGRNALIIDSGRTCIMGRSMEDSSFELSGSFQGTPVTLGELRTDAVGRLLVLPGFGVSDSPSNQPVFQPEIPSTFNNAAGWYDDICDGPVHAKVCVGDKVFDADGAWVTSAPPAFAPDLKGWRTMDDLMRSVFISAGMMDLPKRVSFRRDIQPILARMNELQWVNKGFAAMFGATGPMNFSDPELLLRLSKAPESQLYPDPNGELRRTIYNSFRATNSRTVEEGAWPWQYGDAYGYTDPDPTAAPSPRTYLRLPEYYDYLMTHWVEGDFDDDYCPAAPSSQTLDEVPLQEQPEALDRSAMSFCLADAFHPGCELTWPMRHTSLYRAPYRIRERASGETETNYGSNLTTATVLSMQGPLYEQGPGDLTKWMALPWQGDTAYCRSGYDMEYDPYLPTFWPARVPNQVLTKADYDILCDKSKPMDIRIAAFQNRPGWLRQLPAQNPPDEQMMYMIQHFGEMGILEAQPRPADLKWLPETVYVENLTAVKEAELSQAEALFFQDYGKLGYHDRLLREAGWFSQEQRNEFATIKRRGN